MWKLQGHVTGLILKTLSDTTSPSHHRPQDTVCGFVHVDVVPKDTRKIHGTFPAVRAEATCVLPNIGAGRRTQILCSV